MITNTITANFKTQLENFFDETYLNDIKILKDLKQEYTNLTQNIDDGDFYIFLILNKKREMYILLYDFEHNILFDKKDLDIIIPLNNINLTEWAENTIKENVTKPKKYASVKKPKYIRDDTDDFDDAPAALGYYYESWRDNYYGSK